MTATEASRSFAALLDEAEHGETVIITRGGKRIAAIGPAGAGNGEEVRDLLRSRGIDRDFGRDVRAARDAIELEVNTWPEG